VNVSLNTALLSQGTQTGIVTITSPGAAGSPQTVQVTANVTAPPSITLNNSDVAFSYRIGDPTPASQIVQVGSTGASLPFTISVTNAPWLSVTPTSGNTSANLTLAVDPSKVQVGSYSATVTVNSTGTAAQSINVSFSVSAPLPTLTEVRNGATNQQGPVAPGLIIVMTGTFLGSDPQTNFVVNGDVLATTLANTRVRVGGYLAPLLFANSTQVSAIVPYEMAGKTSTFVQVEYLGQRSNSVTVPVAATAPGVFTVDNSGVGQGAIMNQDGSVNSTDNPESAGRTITVLATGEGQTIPSGVDGKVANDVIPRPVNTVTATINGLPAEVQSAGTPPGEVAGKLRVVIVIPPGATSGDLVLRIGGNDSPPGVTVAIR
jgi:uncharacterized protein (TIGR03437 family)